MRDDMCGTTELCRGTDQPSSANNVTRYIGHFKPCKTDVSASTTASAAVMLHAAAGLPGAEQYAKGERCGFGTFGTVRRATCVADGSTVAIKKIRYACTDDNGISMAAIREVKILRHLSHENIVPLVNVFVHKDSIKLVFEYLKSDLQKVMDDASCTLGAADIKCYMLMLLRGLAHLHENEILHRDIKPNNLLISEGGILKIADFGRAKMSPSAFADDCAEREGDRFTSQVVMLQYRAPELLCGAQTYGPPIDVWACAVIMAELLTRKTFFRGERDVHMLCCIKEVLGAPGEGALADMGPLPEIVRPIFCSSESGVGLATHFQNEGVAALDDANYLDLLGQMLDISPRRRVAAAGALQHPYFRAWPHPTPSELLPKPSSPAPDEDGGSSFSPSGGCFARRLFEFG